MYFNSSVNDSTTSCLYDIAKIAENVVLFITYLSFNTLVKYTYPSPSAGNVVIKSSMKQVCSLIELIPQTRFIQHSKTIAAVNFRGKVMLV